LDDPAPTTLVNPAAAAQKARHKQPLVRIPLDSSGADPNSSGRVIAGQQPLPQLAGLDCA
jgi:hypothetical protein